MATNHGTMMVYCCFTHVNMYIYIYIVLKGKPLNSQFYREHDDEPMDFVVNVYIYIIV